MIINFEVPDTLYNDAKMQLLPYGKTVENKLKEIIQDLAFEKREKSIEVQINNLRATEIDTTDFVI